MIANKCLYCGSYNLRADRALSGRLVCTSCGNPYGVKKVGRNKLTKFDSFSLNKKYWLLLCLLIIGFILAII